MVVVSVMIASFLSAISTSLAALATSSGRIERGVISDMAVAAETRDQSAGFSGELIESPPF